MCDRSVACPEKKIVEKQAPFTTTTTTTTTTKEESGNEKNQDWLWGFLFLPGFCVGVCGAWIFYRQRRNNRSKESAQGQNIQPQYDNRVPVNRANPPYQQGPESVPHVVAQPQKTNVRGHGESVAITN